MNTTLPWASELFSKNFWSPASVKWSDMKLNRKNIPVAHADSDHRQHEICLSFLFWGEYCTAHVLSLTINSLFYCRSVHQLSNNLPHLWKVINKLIATAKIAMKIITSKIITTNNKLIISAILVQVKWWNVTNVFIGQKKNQTKEDETFKKN